MQDAILALSDRTIDWKIVAAAVDGIHTSSRLDLSVPIEPLQNNTNQVEALTSINERQITALQDNTAALQAIPKINNEPQKTNVIVKVIGNIDNMKEFVKVVIDERINNLAMANMN